MKLVPFSLLLAATVALVASFSASLTRAYSIGYKLERIQRQLGDGAGKNNAGDGALRVDATLFDVLTSAPRNYSLVLMTTAMDPQFGCQPCRQVLNRCPLMEHLWSNGTLGGLVGNSTPSSGW